LLSRRAGRRGPRFRRTCKQSRRHRARGRRPRILSHIIDREQRQMKRLFWILQCGGWGIFFAGMFLAGIGQWPLGYTLVKKLSITLAGFALTLLLRIAYRA